MTLSFSIDPQGAATSYKILYGGQETAAVDIGSASGPQVFTRSLTGLAPDTEYTVQVVATSAGGTSGPDGSDPGRPDRASVHADHRRAADAERYRQQRRRVSTGSDDQLGRRIAGDDVTSDHVRR